MKCNNTRHASQRCAPCRVLRTKKEAAARPSVLNTDGVAGNQAQPASLVGFIKEDRMKSRKLQLEEMINHLQLRAMQLFEYGRKREAILENALANVWNFLDESRNNDSISKEEICEQLIEFTQKELNKANSIDLNTVEDNES